MEVQMVQTKRGKVIDYPSIAAAHEGQKARNKLAIKKKANIPIADAAATLLDAALAANGFKWQHFGLSKSPRGVLAIFKHKATGYLVRVYLDEQEYFEHQGKVAIHIDSWADDRVYSSEHDVFETMGLTGAEGEAEINAFLAKVDAAMLKMYKKVKP